ncbi:MULTISPECIES: 5-oxoprolinase subunit PxpB [unclassified Pseudomonas]|uniref:5-oxoprolinase subunit PxpB n=1 Tax=unclassified Pseudomonas TaxID=196821 RepID=UPI000BD7838B|nr:MULTISPECIES: 5-oxoprolinase subunit PxpB [unclassified Pseudomonas]PVZ12489.1 KipI family sensor histidine kinase inhibitor [Pseudomonas sp. URIL14HWK12:I12]PVZ23359.1 KipI family sensor histidine kinase inhibitor [Pseudomonas sp. URIL14HWK12:I10]PVZ32689.1 KipI family sensor histidine kinase inhibitor [Pseudomonas sp. URIL14HWK12:I11]SNZ13843.1 sensor histidine kinase inhibitor, KipI family [Pseudomonas sp. URIL14HWK12:I9]
MGTFPTHALSAPTQASQWPISPCGDTCLIIELAQCFSASANRQAAALADHLQAQRQAGELRGVLDVVPAMVTVGVHYHPTTVKCLPGELPWRSLARQLREMMLNIPELQQRPASNVRELPVCYGGEHGPDLEAVAARCGLTPAELIACHSAEPVTVVMLGFAPGHAYLGQLDARLSLPRREVPRTQVARGSIGLANRQSVIYPSELPGGWHLIGRTPVSVFDLARPEPCLLRAGDRVQFVPIEPRQFQALAQGQP